MRFLPCGCYYRDARGFCRAVVVMGLHEVSAVLLLLLILHMRRDKLGYIYMWVAHVARQGGLCQGLICDDLWPGGILVVDICVVVYVPV